MRGWLWVKVKFISLSSLKHKFTIVLKEHTDFEQLHHFFANVLKMPKDITKIITKAMKSELSN